MRNIHKIGKELFITSDETAYPYALHLKNQEVLKIKGVGENSGELYHDKGFSYPEEYKKIILTTDQELIKDGVQAIDDAFLEWFFKNRSCERIEVNGISDVALGGFADVCYKIIIPRTTEQIINEDYAGGLEMGQIIPKEEPKQELEKEMFELEQELDIPSHLRWHNSKPKQETLEEAAENYTNEFYSSYAFKNLVKPISIDGAKWQQERMYSYEEVLEQLNLLYSMKNSLVDTFTDENDYITMKWFEQFKKK